MTGVQTCALPIFSETITMLDAWVASLAYTAQLYFDFSGYSDMALGIGLMFNIRLPANFNSPYKATSIIDFWKRWHMTLTNFITTYVYTPMVRSFGHVSFVTMLSAIFMSMLISGFWHGAGWTFLLWGCMHGTALVINHCWKKFRLRMPAIPGWLLTFLFLNTSFVIFRAKDLAEAWRMLRAMAGGNGILLPAQLQDIFPSLTEYGVVWGRVFSVLGGGDADVAVVLISIIIAVSCKNNSLMYLEVSRFTPSRMNQVLLILMIITNMLYLNSIRAKDFLYFGF